MKFHRVLYAMALAALCAPTPAFGETIVGPSVGTGWVDGLTEGPPGAAFLLDYAALDPRVGSPIDVVGVTLAFDTLGVLFEDLTIQLDVNPSAAYSFPSPNGQQVAHMLYDPAYFDPGSIGSPHSEIDPVWKAELSDGVLSGRLWVEGVSFGVPTEFSLGGQGWFVVPAPAGLALLAGGGLALVRRRR